MKQKKIDIVWRSLLKIERMISRLKYAGVTDAELLPLEFAFKSLLGVFTPLWDEEMKNKETIQ